MMLNLYEPSYLIFFIFIALCLPALYVYKQLWSEINTSKISKSDTLCPIPVNPQEGTKNAVERGEGGETKVGKNETSKVEKLDAKAQLSGTWRKIKHKNFGAYIKAQGGSKQQQFLGIKAPLTHQISLYRTREHIKSSDSEESKNLYIKSESTDEYDEYIQEMLLVEEADGIFSQSHVYIIDAQPREYVMNNTNFQQRVFWVEKDLVVHRIFRGKYEVFISRSFEDDDYNILVVRYKMLGISDDFPPCLEALILMTRIN